MKTDLQGCSTCQEGQESYEYYYSEVLHSNFVQYDYRHTNGELFSCVDNSLEGARQRRDKWLK